MEGFSTINDSRRPRGTASHGNGKVIAPMLAETQSRERSHQLSPERVAVILAELDTILASATFSSSKRCHDFLDYVVRHALAGDYDELNERFLGVELFGRKIDFDTGADSIVRVRASDVRRRLAQYYSERSASSSVTITLSSGTYIPSFQWNSAEEKKTGNLPSSDSSHRGTALTGTDLSPSTIPYGMGNVKRPLSLIFAVMILIAAIGGWRVWSVNRRDVTDRFWAPFLENKAGVTLCLGDSHLYWISSDLRQKVEDNQPTILVRSGDIVKASGGGTQIGDARGVINLAGFLSRRGLVTQVVWPEESRNLSLEHTNVVYFGAFNNVWVMNLNQNLRFFFDSADGEHGPIWFIRDRQHPEKRWITEKTTAQRNDRSYALITRIVDPDRKRVQMAIGGVNEFGTQAASQFLTDAGALNEFADNAPRGWEERNLQILLEVDISGMVVVNPKIIAIHVW